MPSGQIRDDIIINGIFYVVGQGFIRLMQMLVAPLVFCSLVCGSMSIGDTKKLGQVGVKTMLFYLATTACAIALALSVANVIDPGIGLISHPLRRQKMSEVAEATNFADTTAKHHSDEPIFCTCQW